MVGNVLVESHTPCTLKTSFVDKTGMAHKFILERKQFTKKKKTNKKPKNPTALTFSPLV
jgi:hypothetical protein